MSHSLIFAKLFFDPRIISGRSEVDTHEFVQYGEFFEGAWVG